MGRREAEDVADEDLPAEVRAALQGVGVALGGIGYNNAALRALAALALVEYRLAVRAVDRRQWHQQLLQVARAAQPTAGKQEDKDVERVDTAGW